jgi:putative adenylate-forming enzyme
MLGRFVRARWGFRFRTRGRFDAWQNRRIRSFLRRLSGVPFYRSAVPGGAQRLDQLPIVDKSISLEHFDELNTRGVRLTDALGVALEAEHTRDFSPVVAGDLTVGLSSGTSGRRGAFLVSPRERMLWAGTILARVLDRRSVGQLLRPWRPPVRISFFLRAGGNLYESVASSRIRFSFHDLTQPIEVHIAALNEAVARGEGPDVLVAPASVLAALARQGQTPTEEGPGTGTVTATGTLRVSPRLVVSVAEVLEPDLAATVESAWGVAPRQVYQATEGLLGITCSRGSLHLNEESVHIEREWLDAERTLFTPVVTDFDRRTQIIARYRLDDVLRVDQLTPERCACGRVTAVLAGIDGRTDAVLRLPSRDGLTVVEVFPDVVRRVMAVGSDAYSDWRIRQSGLDLRVSLAGASPEAVPQVVSALRELFETYGCTATIVEESWRAPEPGTKVRRIVREHAS